MLETQALLRCWRTLHKVESGWADQQIQHSYMQPITAALMASTDARRGFREKVQLSNAEVLAKFETNSRTRIVRWLLVNGTGRSPEIAAALGLKEAAVRQRLTRLLRDREWLDYQRLEMTRESRGLYRLRRIEKAESAEN
jgi:hypothetical protein